jgi:arsenate reductase
MTTVLFACVHNAGRSQIAAAFFNALADPSKARAISAGTDPAERIHPEVVVAMAELGIEIQDVKPRRLTEAVALEAQLLVTMGCGEECPVLPGLQRIDWVLKDPKGARLEQVRAIRDEIKDLINALLEERGWRRAAEFAIRRACDEDFTEVSGMLQSAKLPLEGVRDHWRSFLVGESGGSLAGAIGLEVYGREGLLRSLVVRQTARNCGLGGALVTELLLQARRAGLAHVFLLTTTAADFFSRRGFVRIRREDAPSSLLASRELQDACPSSATLMHIDLATGTA